MRKSDVLTIYTQHGVISIIYAEKILKLSNLAATLHKAKSSYVDIHIFLT